MVAYESMIKYTKAQLERLLKIDFIRFCIVGGTGFVINFAILLALPKLLHIPRPVAQFIGAEVALFSNFLLHHHWTYKNNQVEKTFYKLLLQFHATTWPAILGSTVMVSVGLTVFHLSELLALAISSAIALGWNFGWSKYVIWKDVGNTSDIEAIL
jgi:dolichol-phosphate mannosyltransferase